MTIKAGPGNTSSAIPTKRTQPPTTATPILRTAGKSILFQDRRHRVTSFFMEFGSTNSDGQDLEGKLGEAFSLLVFRHG